jgi:hypothetical protein
MLLYITHVTFPLPRPFLLRQRLLGDIASHFTKVGGDFHAQVPVELYLWPAVIAAIAARDEPCRALFVGIVRRLCGLRSFLRRCGRLRGFVVLVMKGHLAFGMRLRFRRRGGLFVSRVWGDVRCCRIKWNKHIGCMRKAVI